MLTVGEEPQDWEEEGADRKRKTPVKWLRAVHSDSRAQPLARHLTMPGRGDFRLGLGFSPELLRRCDTPALRNWDEDSGSVSQEACTRGGPFSLLASAPHAHPVADHSLFLGDRLWKGTAEKGSKAPWETLSWRWLRSLV